MTFNFWTSQETTLLREYLAQGAWPKQISEAINRLHRSGEPGFPTTRSPRSVEKRAERLGLVQSPARPQLAPRAQRAEPPSEFPEVDDRWESIKRIQQQYKESSKFVDVGLPRSTAEYKILSLSDIHFPFARLDFLRKAINDHSDANCVVLNGDIIDGYVYSTFEKESVVAARDEYNCAFDFVEDLSRRFERVVLISGNHDDRLRKMLGRMGLPREAWAVMRSDLIACIANGERLNRDGTLAEKVSMPNVYYPSQETWWVQIGKTLFIHPHSKGSSKPAFTVSGWDKKFSDRLGVDAFDSIVCGHTHHVSKHVEGRHLLIEQGCLCDAMAYSWKPNNMFLSSAINGYAVIYQDAMGNTDFNKSTYVYLGQLLPVDKPILRGNVIP